MNDYPMLHLMVDWGRAVAVVLAVLVAGAGIWAAVTGAGAIWAVIGLGAATLGYVLLASYVELVRLVMDMLLPKP
jgi:hypothetical protein